MKPKSLVAYAISVLLTGGAALTAQSATQTPTQTPSQTIDLPTSKQLLEEVPGHPQRLNSLPVSIAVSPDKRYVVTLNDGYGTYESHYDQSLVFYAPQP